MAALTGVGIQPSGAIGTQLTDVTREGYIPWLVVQIYKSRPLLAALLDGAQIAMGGFDAINMPVQGESMVTTEWVGYSGQFTGPTDTQGVTKAQFALKMLITAIPFLSTEALIQVNHAIIPLIEARMNDAKNVIRQELSNQLYNNTTDTTKLIGLPAAIDDGTNVVTYGNLSRTTNTWWKSAYIDHGGSVDPTRIQTMQHIARLERDVGEMPSFGVAGFGTWTKLADNYLGLERYNISPAEGFETARAGFRALMVSGIPIYADPDCPEGRIYYINSNYLNLYLHQNAAFNFTGFESTLSNFQLGYVGAIVTVLELANMKPAASMQARGLTSLTL